MKAFAPNSRFCAAKTLICHNEHHENDHATMNPPIQRCATGRSPRRSQGVFAACLIFLSISAAAQSPAPSTNPRTAIADNAGPPTGVRTDENVFYIRSQGLIADSSFIAASLDGGGSAMSEKLAFLILQARDHAYQITVAGGNELKTMRVIKDAFESAGATELALLDFTFVGSAKAAVRVEKLVKAVHGTFRTRATLYP